MIDIEELKWLLAEATPGEWKGCDCGKCGLLWSVELDMCIAEFYRENETGINGQANRAATVALHNAAPALLAELEAARKVCEAADELRLSVAHDLRCSESDNADEIHDSTEQLAAALDKLGKAFAEWQKARGE